MQGALQGIKVIEVSQVLAAPFCGYLFSLLGAEVIKVELPDAPDCARHRGPIPELNKIGLGLTYQVQGANKKSLAIDLRTSPGREALLRLVETADVFLENYATGVMEELGLGYDILRVCNPGIVYCSMTGYGDKGPKASKGAYDNTIQAASGIISQSGGTKPGLSLVDYAAGYSAAFAISAALLQKDRTGKGCYISASMLEVALSLMSPEVAAKQCLALNEKPKEAGISSFDTSDGILMLGAFKPSQYRKLSQCLIEEGFDIPLIANIADWEDVWLNSKDIHKELENVFIRKSTREWQKLLDKWDVPAEPIMSLEEAIKDEQIKARGYYAVASENSDISLPSASFQMSKGGPVINRSPPALGQDSREVLKTAGLNENEIDWLFLKRVVV